MQLPDERGRHGPYGGQYIPEPLMAAKSVDAPAVETA
jgi:tryptophan synthase beta subunit